VVGDVHGDLRILDVAIGIGGLHGVLELADVAAAGDNVAGPGEADLSIAGDGAFQMRGLAGDLEGEDGDIELVAGAQDVVLGFLGGAALPLAEELREALGAILRVAAARALLCVPYVDEGVVNGRATEVLPAATSHQNE